MECDLTESHSGWSEARWRDYSAASEWRQTGSGELGNLLSWHLSRMTQVSSLRDEVSPGRTERRTGAFLQRGFPLLLLHQLFFFPSVRCRLNIRCQITFLHNSSFLLTTGERQTLLHPPTCLYSAYSAVSRQPGGDGQRAEIRRGGVSTVGFFYF